MRAAVWVAVILDGLGTVLRLHCDRCSGSLVTWHSAYCHQEIRVAVASPTRPLRGSPVGDRVPAGVLQIGRFTSDGELVLVIAGELDISTAPQLRDQLGAGLAARPPVVLVDLSGLRFCDLRGSDALHDAVSMAAAAGSAMRFRGMSPRLAWLQRRFPGREPTPPVSEVLVVGDLQIDVVERVATAAGQRLSLTRTEFDLLSCLARSAGVPLPPDRLLAEVWGYDLSRLGTLASHIRRLRSRIEDDPSRPARLQTVWGVGHRLVMRSPRCTIVPT